jgi:hypothetical protein
VPTVELTNGEVVVFRDGQLIRARATRVEVTHDVFTGLARLQIAASVDTIHYNQPAAAPSSPPVPIPSTSSAAGGTSQGRLLVLHVDDMAGGIQRHTPHDSRLYVFPGQPVAFVYRDGAYRPTNISADYVRRHFNYGEYFNGPPDNRGPGENYFALYSARPSSEAPASFVTVNGSRCYICRDSIMPDQQWRAIPAVPALSTVTINTVARSSESRTVNNSNLAMINAWGPRCDGPTDGRPPPEPKHTPIPISDERPRRLLLQN